MKPVSPHLSRLLEELVNQNSHFKNQSGVHAVLKRMEKEAIAFGAKCDYIANEANLESVRALRIRLPEPTPDAPLITLITHADTVFAESSPFQKISWLDEGERALGPGVIDDKGGIVIALEILRRLVKTERNYRIQLLCMPGEEIGSPGCQKFLAEVGKASSLILGYEPSLHDGSIIHSRRGNRWYEITMKGPGGHAGRDAGKVTNPLAELSHRISKLMALNDPARGVSVTPASIKTDTTGFNVIPTLASVKLDVRYNTNSVRDEVHEQMLEHLDGTEWTLAEDCPAMPLNGESERFGKIAVELIQKIENSAVSVIRAHGSSDCNYVARRGIPILDGLGAVGSGLHTQQETLIVSSLESRTELSIQLIQKFADTIEE